MKNGMKKKHVIIFLIITILSIVRICYLYIETSKIETIYFKNKDIINTVDGNYIQLIKYEIIDSWEDEMVDNEEYNKEIKEMVDHNFVIKLTYKTNSQIFKENNFYKFNKNGASVFLGYTNDIDDSFEVFVYYPLEQYLEDKKSGDITLYVPIQKELSPKNKVYVILLDVKN